jgi:hypothetical protein
MRPRQAGASCLIGDNIIAFSYGAAMVGDQRHGWPYLPHQLIGALDLIQFDVNEFVAMLQIVRASHATITALALAPEAERQRGLPKVLESLPPLRHALDRLQELCSRAEVSTGPISHVRMVIDRIGGSTILGFDASGLSANIDQMCFSIVSDLNSRKFMFLPHQDAAKYEQPCLFGPEVAKAFPLADHDIREAGSCYAAGRYTACVYHCMNAIEAGLRAWCNTPEIQVPWDNFDGSWGDALGELKKSVNKIEKVEDVRAYRIWAHDVISHVWDIKTALRDTTMHGQLPPQDQWQAGRVLHLTETVLKKLTIQLRPMSEPLDSGE